MQHHIIRGMLSSNSKYQSAYKRAVALSILYLTGMQALANPTLATDQKQLSFYHTHTGKSLDVIFYRNGKHDPDALCAVNEFLADFRTGDATEIDPALLDLLFDLRASLNSTDTFEVISAYRSPKTNNMLRSKSNGVAKSSQHLLGKAIDVRLRGIETSKLHDAALKLKRGGVGFYRKSDFVHVDTGRVRTW